jgi:prepilin-type processing-associated H-X9-DG protein
MPTRQCSSALASHLEVRHKSDTVFRTNPVVANAAFADGSVRTVPADVDAAVFRAMATIAGREETRIDFDAWPRP